MSRKTTDPVSIVRAAMVGLLVLVGTTFAADAGLAVKDTAGVARSGDGARIPKSGWAGIAPEMERATDGGPAGEDAADAGDFPSLTGPSEATPVVDAVAPIEASEAAAAGGAAAFVGASDAAMIAEADDPPAGDGGEIAPDPFASDDEPDDPQADPFEQTFRYLKAKYGTETLTGDWFGLGETLDDHGVIISLLFTQAYQINLQGGLATHRRSGRWTGNYDLFGQIDLGKLVGLKHGMIYALAEGTWSNGLDPSSIGSAVGNVNANTLTFGNGDEAIYLSELWYQQGFFNNRLRVRIGKMDLTGGFEFHNTAVGFDHNASAFDETSQFMNAAFVNNPTIPFPQNGLGVSVLVEPIKRVFLAAAVVDQQADVRETGFNTTFHDEDYFFAIFETGVTPAFDSANGWLPGAYRVGFWYDPRDKVELDGESTKRDDVGFYLSFDQVLCKENPYIKDNQGLTVFARYGFAHSDVNPVKCFWSAGSQYKGLIPRRDDDVFAFAFGQGKLDSDAGYNKDHETIMEVYYNAQLTPWFSLSPSLQYIWDPGAVHGVGDAIVLGIRMQLCF